jgi:hypothetical protein
VGAYVGPLKMASVGAVLVKPTVCVNFTEYVRVT